MTQTMTQTLRLRALALFKLLRDLVDLVGIEPTTSSMPWKRAPSCATGPLAGKIPLGFGTPTRNSGSEYGKEPQFIFAYRSGIVNAGTSFEFLSTDYSGIIDRARHLHNFPNTI
jgi:hypothetical protein